jgi:hypothetical protein
VLSSALASHAQGALTYNAHGYLEAEQHIEEALQQAQLDNLSPYLAKDFVLHSPGGKNFDKNLWVKNQTSRKQGARLIRDVSVELLDDIAIVSFERVDPKTFKTQFVVDVWRDTSHKLQHRYESPMRPGPKSIRPDGKG